MGFQKYICTDTGNLLFGNKIYLFRGLLVHPHAHIHFSLLSFFFWFLFGLFYWICMDRIGSDSTLGALLLFVSADEMAKGTQNAMRITHFSQIIYIFQWLFVLRFCYLGQKPIRQSLALFNYTKTNWFKCFLWLILIATAYTCSTNGFFSSPDDGRPSTETCLIKCFMLQRNSRRIQCDTLCFSH